VQLLHKEVSVATLTTAPLDALMMFCDRMLDHEPADAGALEYDPHEAGTMALIEDQRQ
jgi:hypothetical protein